MILPLAIIADNLIKPDEVVHYDKQESQQEVKLITDRIKKQYDKRFEAIAYMPTDIEGKEVATHLDVMLASQELNIKCVNAYSGTFPNGYINFFSNATEAALKSWLDFNSMPESINQIQTINDFGKKEIERKHITLKANNGKYICADIGPGNPLLANRDTARGWETFYLTLFENNECVISAHDDNFFSLEPDKENKILATEKKIGELQLFTLVSLNNGYVAFKAHNGKFVGADSKNYGQLFARNDSISEEEKFVLTVVK